MKKKTIIIAAALTFNFQLSTFNCFAQNIGISIDGSAPETGVLLDVKGTNTKATTAVQNIFQIKSYDASTDALKLRLGLATNATYSLSYGIIEVPEYAGGALSAYRNLVLQPSGGNVGIGTTTPTKTLQVESVSGGVTNGIIVNTGIYETWIINNDVAGIARNEIYFRTAGLNTFSMRSMNNNFDILNFVAGTGISTAITIVGSNGNVGIGCASPQYPLHVIGNVGVVGTIFATAASVSSGVVACSDIRYKKDITPLPNALSNVMKLQGVNYFWKTKEFPDKQFTDTKQLGFIAQEIEKIYPEVVLTDKDGYKSVDYSRLTPVLVEAIKELNAVIGNQSSVIGKQQLAIDKLQTQLTIINAQLGAKAEK